MKYIRTKDGIYEVNSSNYTIVDGFVTVNALHKNIIGIRASAIINQADTIEELCDEFVLFRDNKPYAIVPNKGNNAELAHDVWKDYRGAIWTEWGLKYVARMNSKGVLELL